VRDPLGGINSLWPLFGIANQLLASIALCLCTTVLLKMHLGPTTELAPKKRNPKFALITFIPLLWLMAVTMTAGAQKIFDKDPRIGFLAAVQKLDAAAPALLEAERNATPDGLAAAKKAVLNNRVLRFNNYLDAVVAGAFLALVGIVFILSVREWVLLIARKRLADLKESKPVWLPDYAIAEGKPTHLAGYATLVFAMAKEISGEAEIERANAPQCACTLHNEKPAAASEVYIATTEARYKSIRRCC
jgi:carbon starvation protein